MAAERSKSDQFQLRLPPGLRERIKAYASYQRRSMNEEIVRILEREFPEPIVADSRIGDLLDLLSVIQRSGATEQNMSKLVSDLRETVVGIYSGRVIGLEEDDREKIKEQYQQWQEREFEYQQDIASMEYDAVEDESLRRTGRLEKFVYPDGTIGPTHQSYSVSYGIGPRSEDDPFIDPFESDK